MQKKQNKPIFYSFFKSLEKQAKMGDFDKLSPTKIKDLTSYVNKYLNAFQKKRLNALIMRNSTQLRRYYRYYITKGFTLNNPRLTIQSIKRIAPKLEKVYKARNADSVNLISTQSPESITLIKNRLWNWIRSKSEDKLTSQSLRDSVKVTEVLRKQDKHFAMILKDQTHKMRGNLDLTIAESLNAIAFIWQTREDKRVVGDPSGFYKPSDITKKSEKVHGNHYVRNGKMYFYHNSWAVEKGYINTKSKAFSYADFTDGMPSVPINCRCVALNQYYLNDILEYDKSLLTKKGLEYISKNAIF